MQIDPNSRAGELYSLSLEPQTLLRSGMTRQSDAAPGGEDAVPRQTQGRVRTPEGSTHISRRAR